MATGLYSWRRLLTPLRKLDTGVIALLKPIRDSILSHESFKLTWIAGDAWQGLASQSCGDRQLSPG